MDELVTWLLVVEYAALGVLALVTEVKLARQRAAWRRLVLHVYTQHPIANPAPPTVTELRTPARMEDDRG